MRLYLPATVADLAHDSITSRVASGVTPALRRALPEEDEEGLELSAFLTAADAAVLRIAAEGGSPVRVVLAIEVPRADLAAEDVAEDLADLPSVLGVLAGATWADVVSIHADDESASALVARALSGDDEAFEELGEVDLLWFDPSERSALRRALTRG